VTAMETPTRTSNRSNISGTRVTYQIASPATQLRERRVAHAKRAALAALVLIAVAVPSPLRAAR